MKTRFTRAAARVHIVIGVLIVLLGLGLALVVLLLRPETVGLGPVPSPQERLARIVLAVGLTGAGVTLGAPFIVFGQLVLVFLDMRRRLARLDRRLRRWEVASQRGQESRLLDRLRPR